MLGFTDTVLEGIRKLTIIDFVPQFTREVEKAELPRIKLEDRWIFAGHGRAEVAGRHSIVVDNAGSKS